MKRSLLTLFIGMNLFAFSQCPFGGTQFPGTTIAAPTTIGQSVTVSTCNYMGEHSRVSGFDPQYQYTINITDLLNAYVTVYDDATNSAVAFGAEPFVFVPSTAGIYKIRWTLNGPAACGTDNSCHTTQITITGISGPCPNPASPGTTYCSKSSVCSAQNFTLSLNGASNGTGMSYQWESSPDNVTYTAIGGATNATYVGNQVAATYYRCLVTCAGGIPDYSTFLFLGMAPSQDCHCTSNATSSGDTELFKVSLATMSQTSTCGQTGGPGSMMNRYSDYTSITPAPILERGVSYPLEVKVGTCGGNYNNMIKVFIDWNRNGDFTDAGETVFQSNSATNGPQTITTTVNVPLTADLGTARMRVISRETTSAAAIVPCGTYGYGETEDYFVDIYPVPSCPQPYNFNTLTTTTSSADLGWTPGGSETEWFLEYDTVGFTLGTGTVVNVTTTPSYQITGLSANKFYDAYLRAYCTPGDTSLYAPKVTFNTYGQGQYMEYDVSCYPGGFIDISNADSAFALNPDGEFGFVMPFKILYQGTLIDKATVGNNGAIELGTLTANISPINGVIGASTNDGLYPLWDDLHDAAGAVFIKTRGASPNRELVVQWSKKHDLYISGNEYILQAIIQEGTNEIFYVYKNVDIGSATYGFGASATIGVSGPNQDIEVSNNTSTFLNENSCAHFYYTDCPNITNLTMAYLTSDEVAYSWNNGVLVTNDFTVVYGPPGFDPATGGTMVNTNSTSIIIPNLTQNTTYDVYIYSNCSSSLQSVGVKTTFTTISYCASPFDVNVATDINKVNTDWDWSANSPAHPVTDFEIIYGYHGFDSTISGTLVSNGTTFNSQIIDPALMASGAYQIYIRAVCTNYYSSFVGPINFTMPLTNDSSCFPQMLPVDNQPYYFNNSEATIQTNESLAAPPAVGDRYETGWGENTLTKTLWYNFVAPASGNMRVSCEDYAFDGQAAVYEVGLCSVFSSYILQAANDNAMNGSGFAPEYTVCGLTPGDTYTLLFDSRSVTAGGIFSFRLSEIIVDAGVGGPSEDICAGDIKNLFEMIIVGDHSGTWLDDSNSNRIYSDSLFTATSIVAGVYNFTYEIVDGCASDEETISIEVYDKVKAGTTGSMTVCKNQPFSLFEGLTGIVNMGGQWLDYNLVPMSSSVVGHTTLKNPGVYSFRYTISNGVCPQDTSYVIVTVSNQCDFLNLDDVFVDEFKVFPVPTSNELNIQINEQLIGGSVKILDARGRLIVELPALKDHQTQINLQEFESGIYFLRLEHEGRTLLRKISKQ
jgi:hypothetical protein